MSPPAARPLTQSKLLLCVLDMHDTFTIHLKSPWVFLYISNKYNFLFGPFINRNLAFSLCEYSLWSVFNQYQSHSYAGSKSQYMCLFIIGTCFPLQYYRYIGTSEHDGCLLYYYTSPHKQRKHMFLEGPFLQWWTLHGG